MDCTIFKIITILNVIFYLYFLFVNIVYTNTIINVKYYVYIIVITTFISNTNIV